MTRAAPPPPPAAPDATRPCTTCRWSHCGWFARVFRDWSELRCNHPSSRPAQLDVVTGEAVLHPMPYCYRQRRSHMTCGASGQLHQP